ncbi:XRE family transcriptional regulator [Bosea sp. (in: a-proteobacteria)]|uniref:helix-turn-helix domain-containing protein n=1 Tax=Bosea sp. (in: a-proteobacteria) TaxID=1871050 RepID=UPI002DDD1A81|nr:XRE family transcriptional regulator [Bosea sp. (in: a-proteobacteria)]HEV2511505.1 XRE family transcriptional regulator [Bosea sp. (in: a-proteobacteria)]
MEAESQDQDVRFGNAVRTRRTQLGVTLDQLAGTSGVSAAALSRVERGLLSPTLRNAIAIARGLGLELAELVERDNAEITRAGENLRFYDEATGIERLALARPSPDVELLSYGVPPGATSSRFAAHKPGTREIFHILAGRLEIHAGQETITLEAGDTATVLVDTEHWFRNVGDLPARILLTVLGP